MAIFRAITFFIHAIVAAFASMLAAVFMHVLPAMLAVVLVLSVVALLCTSCGIGGMAIFKRRGKSRE